ncbi:MAG: M81 family metallopeptidase [Spirochaetaceae bacterium]|jgi:microcystin degradation protein MlrC|nr:M81 family metallopeptidase [Spirochaetaceae bacterium]
MNKMRIITGGMNHESNTLNPIITGADDFVVFYGDDILNNGMLPSYSSTGIIETLKKEQDYEVIPTVFARAVPNGIVSAQFYQHLKDQLLQRIKDAIVLGPVDGLCFALHGSMKVEGLGCAEGDLVRAIRRLLPDIPFTAALDMHATITADMLDCIDGFAGYKTAPHTDCRETGASAARILIESLKTGKKPSTSYCRIPMLIAGEKSESEAQPMRGLIEMCRRAEKQPGVMAASFLLGFPWADDENNAVSALVTSIDNKENADKTARELACAFWNRRKDFTFRGEFYDSLTAVKTAYKAVLDEKQSPVFVSDSGDNPTAGAAGDATDLFEKILETIETAEQLPTPLLYSGFYDAAAAAACVAAGPGAVIDITLGGNWDTINGKKISLKVEVKKVVRTFGIYSSDIALVAFRNILIAITSKHIGFGDEELLPALEINAAHYCLIVVKLGYLEPCFRTIAARSIMAASRGCSNELLETIPYKKLRRPLYPLDPEMEWQPD